MSEPFHPGDKVIVDRPGAPYHGARGVVREHQQWHTAHNGRDKIGPVVGVDVVRKRVVVGFWLPPAWLRPA